MFLKTESDRPVRPSAGHDSGPIRSIGPENGQSEIKPVKPVVQPENRMNGLFRTVRFNFFIYIFPPLSSFPSCETPTPPCKAAPLEPSLSPLRKSPASRTPTTLAKPARDPAGTPPPPACARAGKVLLARRNPPRWKPPPSLCWNPLRWKS